MLTSNEISLIKKWLVECGDIALAEQVGIAYEIKKDYTPVTRVEFAIEQYLSSRLTIQFPSFQIVTEEHGVLNQYNELLWALDPIDGTRVFIAGLPTWGISLGLLRNGRPEAGFFYLPALKEMYWTAGEGAFFNDRLLDCSSSLGCKDPLSFLCVPSNAFLHFDISFPRVRSLGSTAYHLVLAARGAACSVLTRNVSIWDIAGALPILAQTGINVEFLSGKPIDLEILLDGRPMSEPMLVANSMWMEKMRSLIKEKSA
jgi:myo-inositol-1(or 4)-monophosphatase